MVFTLVYLLSHVTKRVIDLAHIPKRLPSPGFLEEYPAHPNNRNATDKRGGSRLGRTEKLQDYNVYYYWKQLVKLKVTVLCFVFARKFTSTKKAHHSELRSIFLCRYFGRKSVEMRNIRGSRALLTLVVEMACWCIFLRMKEYVDINFILIYFPVTSYSLQSITVQL